MKHEIDKELLLAHIQRSDLLGREKLYLEGLLQRNGWIPCSERVPDLFETVLVAYKGYNGELVYAVSERFKLTGKEDVKWSAIAGNTPSHWMPLPEPPGMEDNDG